MELLRAKEASLTRCKAMMFSKRVQRAISLNESTLYLPYAE